jgi:hypothetical protein
LTRRRTLSILRRMTDKPRQQPQLSEHGKAEAARRQQRLADALRDNLRKRKQQIKARDEKPASKEPASKEND